MAQENDPRKLQETARTFMRQGDYSNAVIVLTRANQISPDNLEILKDLAFCHYLKKDYASAIQVAKPLAERKDIDVQGYQITALIYKAMEDRKECERLYRAGIKKFPASGVLYNEYGEMLWTKKEFTEAVKNWEKGIEMDPNYAGNYYNAAKYYYFSADKFWGLIYGEIFVNMESYSDRTIEIKKMLLDGYKKLYTGDDFYKGQDTKNSFVSTCLDLYKKHGGLVVNGITPESITKLRTRFILDWYANGNNTRFAFRLFDHHQQLLKMGYFEAYNQWLLGASASLPSYQMWTNTHEEENKEFLRLQQNRLFKVPQGQYYQTRM